MLGCKKKQVSSMKKEKKEKDYSTQDSQVVTNLTTNWALPILTS